MPIFETEQWVRAPVEKVFRFFSDPRNLPVISPPSSGARLTMLHLVPPLFNISGGDRLAGAGSEIVISVRLLPYFPLRQSWTARVVDYQWCQSFRDTQVSGPFKKFDHTHSFRTEQRNEQSGTLLLDHVEYEIGFGPLGALANLLLVRAMLRQMFVFRHAATSRALEE